MPTRSGNRGRAAGAMLALVLVACRAAADGGDAAFVARATAALKADAQLNARGAAVTVSVAGARVRLSGAVRFYADKLHSERIVRALAADRPLDNALRVEPLMPAEDRDIERAIVALGKLNRFQGAELQIAVSRGAVRVRGVFHDPRDVLFLTEQVAAIEGVRAIEIDALFPV